MASAHDDDGQKGAGPGRRGKSADAFRTISEVSDEVGVPQHVLRFWETRFSQIRPLKRGGGRRYYRPEDIDLLNRIRVWLYNDGYTIKGVQKLLREGGAAADSPAPPPAAPEPPVQPAPAARIDDGGAGEGAAVARAEAAGSAPAPASMPGPAAASMAGDRLVVPRARLEELIASLEEIRDRLRGPPPAP